MKDPHDMATDPKNSIIIISELEYRKQWRIKLSRKDCEGFALDGEPKSCVIDGEPRRISVTPKGLLLVVVKREIHYSVEMYRFMVEGRLSSFSPLNHQSKYMKEYQRMNPISQWTLGPSIKIHERISNNEANKSMDPWIINRNT